MCNSGSNSAGFFFLMVFSVFACGPHYPNSYLMSGDGVLTEAPSFSFPKEIERIQLDYPAKFSAVHEIQTTQVDIRELSEALIGKGFAADHVEAIISDYRTVRQTLDLYKQTDTQKTFPVDTIPQEVPEEFSLYLQGAIYYQADKPANAINAWLKLLNLPASQRQYRSVWAMYMLGNCAKLHRPHIAPLCYQRTRELALEGFRDSLGLAAASYGQEAAVCLNEKQYHKAIQLYLLQDQTGNRSAVGSLLLVCSKVFDQGDPKVLDSLVKQPNSRDVLMAYAISFNRISDSFCPQQILVNSIEQASLETVHGAERVAMIAYQAGDFEKAKRWLSVADMDRLLSRRIRAKILLREGNIEAAVSDLVYIARQTDPYDTLIRYSSYNPYDSPYKVYSELGSLYVSQKMYLQAIEALMRGGNWIDTAYLAERVLTPEELQSYVDENWPASMIEPVDDENGLTADTGKARTIRYLLARRLSRFGRYTEARPYYPNEILEDFDTFVDSVNSANNSSLSQDERANAFWMAAWLTRHKGMEMFGFELDPDWTIFDGNLELMKRLEIRKSLAEESTINIPDPDELQRVHREVAIPDKRFHYRYMASDFAWEAAALMQNENPELARRLCLAGSWTKIRDPKHADVFYKSLVLRCRTTDLGKEADKLRWFPKISDTLKPKTSFEAP
jgi:tetratricopeptide (TPR) repeat protein